MQSLSGAGLVVAEHVRAYGDSPVHLAIRHAEDTWLMCGLVCRWVDSSLRGQPGPSIGAQLHHTLCHEI